LQVMGEPGGRNADKWWTQKRTGKNADIEGKAKDTHVKEMSHVVRT
jgi:hypothetical protein